MFCILVNGVAEAGDAVSNCLPRPFSAGAEAILRMWGCIGVSTRLQLASGAFPVVTGDVDPSCIDGADAFCLEGPVAKSVAARLKIETVARRAMQLELSDAEGQALGQASYPGIRLRRIPANRTAVSEPYDPSLPSPWNRNEFAWQELVAAAPWRPVMFAKHPDIGERRVVAVSDGRRLVFGLPLFDLLVAALAFPPLEHGYYDHQRPAADVACQGAWLCEQLCRHASAAGIPVVRAELWPAGCASALTVRHDDDRPISAASLADLLGFYDQLGIKASWGFLVDKFRPEQARTIAARGHEANLHTIATSEHELQQELTQFHERTGVHARGATAHGGIGSDGYLGAHQHAWAERLGLQYGEILGRSIGQPCPAIMWDERSARISRLLIPPTHLSLDINTKPDGHRLDQVLAQATELLRRGQHVTIMNHPDIHVAELKSLLAAIDLKNVWKTTFADLVAWTRATRFTSQFVSDADGLRITFVETPIHAVKFAFQNGSELIDEPKFTAAANASQCLIPTRLVHSAA